MSSETQNIIEYLVCCIGAFAEHYDLSNQQAYKYLESYKGIQFLINFYDVEHTQSIEDAVEDLTLICQRNGGAIRIARG